MSKRLILFLSLFCILLFGGNESLSAQPQGEQTTLQRGPFLCSGTANIVGSEQVANAFDSVFAVLQEMTQTLSLPPMRGKITVRIFEDETSWKEYFKTRQFNMAYRRSLFVNNKNMVFKGNEPYPVIYLFLSPSFDNDLRHECVHAYLQSIFQKSVPLWLDEGLAEYYEQKDNRVYNPSWFDRSIQRMEKGGFQTLKKLEAMTSPERMTNNDYSDSWAWVNYLLNGSPKTRSLFAEHVVELTQKKLFYTSMTKRLAKAKIVPEKELIPWYFKLREQKTTLAAP